MFEIRQREVPEQLVLSERHQGLRQVELADRLPEVLGRLGRLADQQGGGAGAPFVVYHGEEFDEHDISLEVCVPVQRTPAGAAVRPEPAHREAYARLTRAQFAPPTVGEAYGAVLAWVSEHNEQVAGDPREVYLTDVIAAAPDDEVVDVAFPIR